MTFKYDRRIYLLHQQHIRLVRNFLGKRLSQTISMKERTDDIDASVAELDHKEIKHEDIRIDGYTSKRFVFFQDPDGLPIELYEK